MDANGACVACGLPSDASANTQPNGADAVPIVAVLAPARTADPGTQHAVTESDRDPAATNPGSGVFCGRCGSAVDPLSDFCGICGFPLRPAVAARQRQERLRGTGPRAPLAEADAADTLPPRRAPRAAPGQARLLGALLVGVLVIGIAFGVLILHMR